VEAAKCGGVCGVFELACLADFTLESQVSMGPLGSAQELLRQSKELWGCSTLGGL